MVIGMTRLNKYLAECGICSRREADRLIEQGRVYVNSQKASSGMQVGEQDTIEVNGKNVKPASSKVVLAYNKPAGITCTEKDRHAEKTIIEAIKYPIRLTYAGRLDKDTVGLVILTDDGDFAHRVIAPGKGVFKVYLAELDGDFTDDDVKRFEQGIEIDGGELCRPARLKRYNNGIYNAEIHISEGKYHQVKRMAAAIGLRVLNLKRVRIGELELDADLKPGEARELTPQEIDVLIKNCW